MKRKLCAAALAAGLVASPCTGVYFTAMAAEDTAAATDIAPETENTTSSAAQDTATETAADTAETTETQDTTTEDAAQDTQESQPQESEESSEPETEEPAQTVLDNTIFGDAMPSDWAAEDIRTAISEKLVPQNLLGQWTRTITREEFADVLTALLRNRAYYGSNEAAKMLNEEILDTENPFTDTKSENIVRLYKAQVLTGTSATAFSPDASLTREAAAAIAYRLVTTDAFTMPFPDQYAAYEYKDQEDISDWAETGINFCKNTGVLSGVGQDRFSPQTDLTVEQAILLTLRLRAYHTSMQATPITFQPWGVPMLYSNDPEELLNGRFESAGIYLAETKAVDGQTMDIEYYHTNYMGSYQNMIVGVVATNNSKKKATIDIDKSVYAVGKDATNVSEQCYQRFLLAGSQDPQELQPGETRMIIMNVVQGGYLINGRSQITPHGENINLRLVAVKKQLPPERYLTLPQGVDDGHRRTSGVFKYSERTTQIDAAQVKNFTLCGNTEKLRKLNPGEFPQSIDDVLAVSYDGPANRAYYLDGNFATIYHLNMTNAAGKKIYIRPNDLRIRGEEARYFVYSAVEGWHDVTATYEKPALIETLSTANEVCIRFLLLGGNYGNVGFHISD